PFAPPDARRIGVGAGERRRSFHLAHQPLARLRLLDFDHVGAEAVAGRVLLAAPAAQVVRTRHHAGADAFGQPDAVHEVADLGADAHQVAVGQAQALAVAGVDPQGIALRDLVEPLGRAAAGVDERWQPEGGQEAEFARG